MAKILEQYFCRKFSKISKIKKNHQKSFSSYLCSISMVLINNDTFERFRDSSMKPSSTGARRHRNQVRCPKQGSTDRLVRGPTGPNRSESFKILLVLVRSGVRFGNYSWSCSGSVPGFEIVGPIFNFV